MRRTLVTALAVTALAVPLGLVSAAGTAAAATPVPPRVPATDFNHDGYQDLVLGAPGATVSGKENAGAVSVVYGGKNGPDIAHAKVLTRSTTGIPGAAEEGGYFGERITSGDLDGDSYTDLVVAGLGGAPSVVLWGSAAGLSGQGSVALPTSTGMFAVGDFNGDGHRDLVTDDYPRSDDPDDDVAGMTVSYGPFDRASGKPASQDSIATSQTFGPSDIVVGDMTGDGADDIVTSHGFEESAYASKFWKGGKSGVSHTAKSLTSSFRGAVGDVDGDGYGDLVVHDIGDNYEDIPYEKGTVLVMYGTADGPSTTRTKTITQDTAGVPGVGESGDMFGTDLSMRRRERRRLRGHRRRRARRGHRQHQGQPAASSCSRAAVAACPARARRPSTSPRPRCPAPRRRATASARRSSCPT